jgi:hypothetical protein
MLLRHSDLITCSMRGRIEILHFEFELVTVGLYVDFINNCIIHISIRVLDLLLYLHLNAFCLDWMNSKTPIV